MFRYFICCHKSSISEARTLPFTTEPLKRNIELIKAINMKDPAQNSLRLALHLPQKSKQKQNHALHFQMRSVQPIKVPCL